VEQPPEQVRSASEEQLDRPLGNEGDARKRLGSVRTLPEMSQAGLNCLVRGIHHILHRHDEPTPMQRTPRGSTPDVVTAFRTFRALRERAVPAFDRLGSKSFADLGAALLGLSPAAYAKRAELLAGLRLLPLGRLFRDGQDIYPAMLTAWARASHPQP
jgi:intracellular multiplication protein IcmJ